MTNKEFTHISTIIVLFLVISSTFFIYGCGNSIDEKDKSRSGPITPNSVYTRDEPGNWSGLEDEHLPVIKILHDQTEKNIIVYVNLDSASSTHYIERIGIMDKSKKDLAGVNFIQDKKRVKVKATLTLWPLPTDEGIKVYVKCSKHDLWIENLYK